MTPDDQFLATCGSAKTSQFFDCFGDVARCVRVVDGESCGGRYGIKGFVDSGTGGEMCFNLTCNKCQHTRFFDDSCVDSQSTQKSQCGPLPRASDDTSDNVADECSLGKAMLYNFLLAGRGMYEQYRAIRAHW